MTSSVEGFRYGSEQFLHLFNGWTFPDTQPGIVRQEQYVRLRFVNDTDEYQRLGMLHCPVLVHGAFGLSTMVSYEGVTTPYSIGSCSGNFPVKGGMVA